MLKRNFPQHKGIHFIRYADDFIVTGHSKEILENDIKPAITAFLKQRGLELSQEKTRVTHITEGFDFLGQNVRKYPFQGKLKLLIKPAKKNIHSFLEEIRKVFRKARSTTQADLIKILNPKLRGWANYHRSVVSKETFTRIDAVIWHLCFRWAKRRHPGKGKRWVLEQYFKPIKGRSYRFSGFEKLEDGTLQQQTLSIMSYMPIRRHVKILQSAHPYDKKYDEYFDKRTSGKWKNNSMRLSIESYIIMTQKGECPCCSETLKVNQNWCISLKRKASQGGEYKIDNLDVVHDKCYTEWQTKRISPVQPVTKTNGGLQRA
jgi:RNA-directed DNA polymerase